MAEMDQDTELELDPLCDRCGTPITDTRSSVRREGQTYCCANCARADAPEVKAAGHEPKGRACSRCGAALADRAYAVEEGAHVFCCGNCAAAGIQAEPLPEG